ncbi:hypothetical protein AHF37_05992 [Paragonimus kellicotti]|nr:hypothetical protein AHF37_05992 [Paragonimus kellicotti]
MYNQSVILVARNRTLVFLDSLFWFHNLYYTHQIILITMFIFVFSLMKLLYSWHKWYIHYIPEPVIVLATGLVFGGILKAFHMELKFFNEQTFFVIFLPMIVFEAVLHMHKMYFLSNISAILIFGFIGTFLNILFVGISLFLLNKTAIFRSEGLNFHPTAFFLFAVIIGSIDSVVVISLLHEMPVHPSLYYIFLGESVINDGVTLVLFDYISIISCQRHTFSQDYQIAILVVFGINILVIKVIGSSILGAAIGCLTCAITKYTSRCPTVEPLIVLSACFLAYLLDYSISWPGVFSLLVFSLIQTSYTFENISPKSRVFIKKFAHITAVITESLIFLTIGYALVVHQSAWYTNFTVTTVVLCTVSRFVIVYSLSSIADWLHWLSSPIPSTMKFAIAFCGFRGAVSHSLVEIVNPACLVPVGAEPAMIQTTSLFITFFTVVTMGILMRPMLTFFQMQTDKKPISLFMTLNDEVIWKMRACLEDIAGLSEGSALTVQIMRWEHKYLRRFLLRDPYPHDHIMNVFTKITMALHYASLATTERRAEHYLSKLHPQFRQSLLPLAFTSSNLPISRDHTRSQTMEAVDSLIVSTLWRNGPISVELQNTSDSGKAFNEIFRVHKTNSTGAGPFKSRKNRINSKVEKHKPKLPETLITDSQSDMEEDSSTSTASEAVELESTILHSTSSTGSSVRKDKRHSCFKCTWKSKSTLSSKALSAGAHREMSLLFPNRQHVQSMEHLNYTDQMKHAIQFKRSFSR